MEKILILDLGGHSARTVSGCVRECSVYGEVLPADTSAEEIRNGGYKGIILAGDEPQEINREIFSLSLPVLAIGYGANAMVDALGGECVEGEPERGVFPLQLDNTCLMLSSVAARAKCYMSHKLYINRVPTGFRITARTEKSAVAAMENGNAGLYALQFEAETLKTEAGIQMLKNFLYKACSCHAEWTAAAFLRKSVSALGLSLEGHRVLCMLSGKESEEITALLLHKAVGSALTCLFIDNGLLREGESARIKARFSYLCKNNFYAVDAKQRFFGKLIGITDMEAKKRFCREELIRIFEEESTKLPPCAYFADPAVEDDERVNLKSEATNIIVPLKSLLREELFEIGKLLGADELANYSETAAALALYIDGEVSEEKINLLRKADAVFCEAVTGENVSANATLSQNEKTVSLRALNAGGKTAELPYKILKTAARKIKESTGIEKVVYEI